MVEAMDIFNSVAFLDPKCPGCETKVDYDVTTQFDEDKKAHFCKSCGHQVD